MKNVLLFIVVTFFLLSCEYIEEKATPKKEEKYAFKYTTYNIPYLKIKLDVPKGFKKYSSNEYGKLLLDKLHQDEIYAKDTSNINRLIYKPLKNATVFCDTVNVLEMIEVIKYNEYIDIKKEDAPYIVGMIEGLILDKQDADLYITPLKRSLFSSKKAKILKMKYKVEFKGFPEKYISFYIVSTKMRTFLLRYIFTTDYNLDEMVKNIQFYS